MKNSGVAAIGYYEKLWKNRKKSFAKSNLGCKSLLHVRNVLAAYNICLMTIPLIKYAKRIWFSILFSFPPKKMKHKCIWKKTKKIFMEFFISTQ